MPDGVLAVGDVHGRLKDWFGGQPDSVVVLRPDRFVAATCSPQDVSRAILGVADKLALPVAAGVAAAPAGPAQPRRSRAARRMPAGRPRHAWREPDMPIHLECLSHTPLHGYFDPVPAVLAEVEGVLAQARARVAAFDPELVIAFAPDHYNGFFYDLMPPFCIGAAASAVGDFQSLAGPLDVPRDTALALAEAVLAADVDVALSYRMQVDHGCALGPEVLTGSLDRYPVIPVFINLVAAPMASCRRARLLGDAIGRFAARSGKRVLVVGSGGISHEPRCPSWPRPAPRMPSG